MSERHSKPHRKSNIGSVDMSKRTSASKVAIVLVLMALQILFLFLVYGIMEEYILYWRTGALLLSAFVVLYIINKNENPAYKLIWVILVLSVPLVGGALYVILSGNRTRVAFINEALESHLDTFKYMPEDAEIQKEIKQLSKSASVQSTYISESAGYPVYRNTSVKYFPLGETNFESLIEELEKAKHFIFMEYFIIKQGEMWDMVLQTLARKAKDGVDVRLIYDDVGCAMWLP